MPNDGIYLEDIIWTPLGQQHARNFEDLSPALRDEDGEVTLVHSVALTPNGKVKDLSFFSAIETTNQIQNGESENTSMKTLSLNFLQRLWVCTKTRKKKR